MKRGRLKLLKVLPACVILFLVMTGFSMLFPLMPEVGLRLGGSALVLGMVISSYPMGQFIASPFWSRFMAYLPIRLWLFTGIAGYSINTIAFVITDSAVLLSMMRFAGGILASLVLVFTPSIIRGILADMPSTFSYGIYGGTIGMGMTIGPVITAILHNYFEFEDIFKISALVPILVSIPLIFLIPEVNASKLKSREHGNLASFEKLIVFSSFMQTFIIINLQSILMFYLRKVAGWDTYHIAITMFINGVIASLSQLIVGRTNILKPITMLKLSIFVLIPGFLLIPINNSFEFLIVLLGIISSISSFSYPAILTLLTEGISEPEVISYFVGINNSAMSLARILGPPIHGAIFDINSLLPFYFSAFLSLTLLIILCFYYRKNKTKKSQLESQ